MSEVNQTTWNEIISALPGAHILQTWEWGDVKHRFGWKPLTKIWRDPDERIKAAALILTREISVGRFNFPRRVMYVPRGPLVQDWFDPQLRDRVLSDLRILAEKHKAIFIKVDPEVVSGWGVPGEKGSRINPQADDLIVDLRQKGWINSQEQVQFQNTMTIDLSPSTDELLAKMKQKTRYNVRLATRKGVSVRPGGVDDIDLLYRMYAETSLRDGFAIRHKEYYQTVWKTFFKSGMAEPLIAEVEGESVAAVVIFHDARRAWYLYGMSVKAHREKMPNYLLQWEAIKRVKESGCVSYDLWGAPDQFAEDDSLWGVYRFKVGLGGEVVRYIGAWDLPLNPMVYRLYTQMLPRFLARLRQRGKEQTQGSIQAG